MQNVNELLGLDRHGGENMLLTCSSGCSVAIVIEVSQLAVQEGRGICNRPVCGPQRGVPTRSRQRPVSRLDTPPSSSSGW